MKTGLLSSAAQLWLFLTVNQQYSCFGFTSSGAIIRETSKPKISTSTLFATLRQQNQQQIRGTDDASTSFVPQRNRPANTTVTGPLFATTMIPGNDTFFTPNNPLDVSVIASDDQEELSFIDSILTGSYLGPRIVLALLAFFYATNFPFGSIMADAFPSPAAVTSARMFLAAIALSPQLPKLNPELRVPALTAGCFMALGYIAQSFALVDTSPATVSFLGSTIVLVVPLLEAIVDKKPMGIRDAPQTWGAAALCLAGVGLLELYDPVQNQLAFDVSAMGAGDALALLQAVGFGTQVYLAEKMVRKYPDQAMPVAATLVSTTAFWAAVWSLADGWVQQPGGLLFTVPQLFFEPDFRIPALCIAWTGLVSTASSFFP